MAKNEKKDFFENVTYRDTETGKFITNWATTLRKKKKIAVEQFSNLLTKCGNIDYPLELKMIEPGLIRMRDENNKTIYMKCHPYRDMKLESYSIVKDKDEYIFVVNQAGEASLRGIMEVEEEISETPKPVAAAPSDSGEASDGVVPVSKLSKSEKSEQELDEVLKNRFGTRLTDEDYVVLRKWFTSALKCKTMTDLVKNIR